MLNSCSTPGYGQSRCLLWNTRIILCGIADAVVLRGKTGEDLSFRRRIPRSHPGIPLLTLYPVACPVKFGISSRARGGDARYAGSSSDTPFLGRGIYPRPATKGTNPLGIPALAGPTRHPPPALGSGVTVQRGGQSSALLLYSMRRSLRAKRRTDPALSFLGPVKGTLSRMIRKKILPRRHGDTEKEDCGDLPYQPCRPVPADLANGSWFGDHGSLGSDSVNSKRNDHCWSLNPAMEAERHEKGEDIDGFGIQQSPLPVFSVSPCLQRSGW